MRQIKFRGKRTDTGEMVFGDLIHGVGSKHGRMYILPVRNIYPKGCNDLDGWEVIPETVGQFTGLLDKDGKEIYEGDILLDRYKDSDEEIVDYYSKVGIRRACFGYITGSKEFLPFCQYDMTEVVVGNIHDNPELLKGGNE